MSGNITVDVVIVGGGVTGLSTAKHLSQKGIDNILLIDGPERSGSSLSPGGISGSFLDNFTRLSVVHGVGKAGEIYDFCLKSYSKLVDFLLEHGAPVSLGRRLRLVNSLAEKREAKIARSQLAGVGFDVTFSNKASEAAGAVIGSGILGVQDEGNYGAWVEPEAMILALKGSCEVEVRNDLLLSLRSSPRGVRLELESGISVNAEMVCLTCHNSIGRFASGLRDVFVPYADQWCEFTFKGLVPELLGSFLSIGHGYQWGGFLPENRLIWGGARFLRKNAGIGDSRARSLSKIDHYLAEEVAAHFPSLGPLEHRKSVAYSGCRPCDELPVIGPMFGDDRVLVAAGFMGTGLSLGFMAGKCLADFVSSGSSEDMCGQLLPVRFRSIKDDN